MAVKVCSVCKEQFDEAAVFCKYCGQATLQYANSEGAIDTAQSKHAGRAVAIGIALIVVAAICIYAAFQI